MNGVDTVNWPLSRVSKADFSSVSSDKVLIFQTTAFETLYWLTKGGLGHCKIIINCKESITLPMHARIISTVFTHFLALVLLG